MSKFDSDVSKALYKMEKKGIFKRKIVLFGAGNNSKKLYGELNYRGYHIHAVIDNNESVIGNFFEGIEIKRAKDFLKQKENYIFLVLSNFYSEIKKQLEECGYIEEKDFYAVVKIESYGINQSDEGFQDDLDCLYEGKKIYEMLIAQYGENVTFLVNPAASIGDVYLMSFYADAYLEKNGDTVFLFGSQTLVRLAEKLNLRESVYIHLEDIQSFIKFAQVFGFEEVKIKLLHTGYVHFRIWSRMLTLIGLTWMEHYRELFELQADVRLNVKKLKWKNGNINNLFEKYKLQEGKTVLLSPYANTMKQLPLRFWDELAKALISKGYCVCTNVGAEDEMAIKNTMPLFIKIDDLCGFVSKAGYFIGVRSGLCDLLYGSDAKKVILYSDEVFDLIDVFEFYSLKRMGDSGSLKEIVFGKELDKCRDEILEYLIGR